MKKLNFNESGRGNLISFFLILNLIFVSATFFSCKTAPVFQEEVNPLELLDSESSFYISIPYKADPELITHLIEANVDSISHENALSLSKRIDVLYAGLLKTRKSTEFQISSSVDLPKVAVSKVFTKKNGWSETIFPVTQNSHSVEETASYSIYENPDIPVSFPNDKIAILGRDINGMLETYHKKAFKTDFEIKNPMIPQALEFLNVEKDEEPCMKFYASRPQSFLTMLTGANLSLKLLYVRGTMKIHPKNDSLYVMNLEFEFKDSRTIPAARGALSVAFGLTDSDVTLTTPWHLEISNINIGKEQLYKLLVLMK